jgi:hypothetical protein
MSNALNLAVDLVQTRARKEQDGPRQCPRCDVAMKRGIAFAPVTGSPGAKMGHLKGYCVMANVAATLVPVHKCPCCGHSQMYGNLYC